MKKTVNILKNEINYLLESLSVDIDINREDFKSALKLMQSCVESIEKIDSVRNLK